MSALRRRLAYGLVFALLACSGRDQKITSTRNAVDPVPSDPNEISSQLKRYRGQTKFLSAWKHIMRAETSRDREGGSGERSIQESDVFKVGKAGSKLLYLLNQYRGLQIVSFADGAEKPKVLGRVPATGNWSDTMYFDEANSRLLVLEESWQTEEASPKYVSRILSYDVSNPTAPALRQEISLDGLIADSRMVGDVLYVATSAAKQGEGFTSVGRITSFKLRPESLSKVTEHTLSMPVSRQENMGIVSVKEGDTFKYYLTAILSESMWGWGDRQSSVELVDVSSPDGAIRPVMRVAAKGNIRERSQVSIKDGAMIVVSNYMASETIMRVAVETFLLPTSTDERISRDEAEYRRLHIERALEKLPQEQRENAREELLNDKELGLKGRFVVHEGSVAKLYADSVVTVGDTQGLSAQLQDVRLDGDRLYVFWVPRNQIDPLDVFDVSNVKQGVRYLGRLQFDGWVERAQPITYQGRRFILALGWIVPSVNNENNRRYPQAALFEVKDENGRTSLTQLDQMTFQDSNYWIDLNSQDKFIEFKENGDGTGSILFSVFKWSTRGSQSGGKLLGFDLNRAIRGEVGAIREGAFLPADSSWVRRVFSNPEIDKFNTFSNTKLGTFEKPRDAVGTANEQLQAISVLELARNIVGYEETNELGVQFIADYNWENSSGEVLLRTVNKKTPDAERSDALSEVKLPGFYLKHLFTSANEMIVATYLYKTETVENEQRYKIEYSLRRITVSDSGIAVSEPITLTALEGSQFKGRLSLEKLPDGKIVAQLDSDIYDITVSPVFQAAKQRLENCNFTDWKEIEFSVIDGTPLFRFAENFPHPEKNDVILTREFAVPLATSTQGWSCQLPVNIPGRIVKVIGDRLITEDSRLTYMEEQRIDDGNSTHSWTTLNTEPVLISLNQKDGSASLIDVYRRGTEQEHPLSIGSEKLLILRSPVSTYRGRVESAEFHWLQLDDQGMFTESVRNRDSLKLDGSISVVAKSLLEGTRYIVVVRGYQKFQVLEVDTASLETKILKFHVGDDPKVVDVVKVLGYNWYSASDGGISFNTLDRTIQIPGGYFGVMQLKLVD